MARCFPSQKLGAIVETLREEGVAPQAVLEGADLSEEQVEDPATRISYAQIFRVLANAARLATTEDTAIRAGQRMHLSVYGMYGFALMTCAGPKEALDFAARYYPIVGPVASIKFSDCFGVCAWEMEPLVALGLEAPLYRFLVDFLFSTHLTLHRDLLGPSLRPLELQAAFPRPSRIEHYERAFGCPIRFGQEANRIRVGNAWLDHTFAQANPATHALVARECEGALRSMRFFESAHDSVRSLVAEAPQRYNEMGAVAEALGVQERTLRRRLKAEKATFQGILQQTRRDLAVELLSSTDLSNEAIAGRLGFSDATSFRHAFRRWTSATPSDFRGTTGHGNP